MTVEVIDRKSRGELWKQSFSRRGNMCHFNEILSGFRKQHADKMSVMGIEMGEERERLGKRESKVVVNF